ncbi:MAG: hypothetical protein IPI57_20680 [Candidatus Competibacteraceae bacterium]|nr:hypothetical protein [Candidatus Competibacteraceae bacterium]
MFDWLWKGLAGLAGVVALWFGFDAARMRYRMEREKWEQDEAMDRMVKKTYSDLAETRKRHAGQAPVNPKKRTDFEQ